MCSHTLGRSHLLAAVGMGAGVVFAFAFAVGCDLFLGPMSCVPQADVLGDRLPCCPVCSGIMKPDIVFFGESLPERFFLHMVDFPTADLLLILGTSLQVCGGPERRAACSVRRRGGGTGRGLGAPRGLPMEDECSRLQGHRRSRPGSSGTREGGTLGFGGAVTVGK